MPSAGHFTFLSVTRGGADNVFTSFAWVVPSARTALKGQTIQLRSTFLTLNFNGSFKSVAFRYQPRRTKFSRGMCSGSWVEIRVIKGVMDLRKA